MRSALLRYGVKGAGFVALNVATQIALVEAGGLEPPVAAALSTAVMPLLGYVAMNRFVFQEAGAAKTRRGYVKRFVQYYAVNMSSKVVNYILFLGFLFAGVWYPVAYILGAAIVFALSFTVNRWLWTGEVVA